MNKKTLFSAFLFCFFFIITPCHAVQHNLRYQAIFSCLEYEYAPGPISLNGYYSTYSTSQFSLYGLGLKYYPIGKPLESPFIGLGMHVASIDLDFGGFFHWELKKTIYGLEMGYQGIILNSLSLGFGVEMLFDETKIHGLWPKGRIGFCL